MRTIQPEDLARTIGEELQEWGDDVQRDIRQAVDETADDVQKDIQANAPSDPRSRRKKYNRSWKVREIKGGFDSYEMNVHSSRYPLSHLLEHGHVIKNGTGRVYGRTKARPHIEPAERKGANALDKKLRRILP